MKKVLLLVAMATMVMVGRAQEPLSYEFVIQKEGADATQIYNALVDWIATSFKAVDGDFYRDKEEKMITKDVSMEFAPGKMMLICYEGHITYKLKFQCRDGRFKMQMTNFVHTNNPGLNASCEYGIINDQPERKSNGRYDEQVWEKAKEVIDAEVGRLEKMLENLSVKAENDDW